MCEKRIASLNDGVTEDIRIGIDEGAEAAINQTEVEDITRLAIPEAFEDQLGGNLDKIDDGITLAVAPRLLLLLALGAFRMELKRSRPVLEGLFIVAGHKCMAWHWEYLLAWQMHIELHSTGAAADRQ